MEKFLYTLAAPIINRGEIGYTGPTSPDGVMGQVLGAVYFWMAVVAVGFIVYGGYLYIISAGDPGKIKKAKDVLLYAVIGIVVVIVAFVITRFVIEGV